MSTQLEFGLLFFRVFLCPGSCLLRIYFDFIGVHSRETLTEILEFYRDFMVLFVCFLVFFLKIDLFIICKYTVAVFRHSRRGHQISLWMVVSHHVVAGI